MTCQLCGADLYYLGQLGDVHHARCRGCGMNQLVTLEDMDLDKDTSSPDNYPPTDWNQRLK
jgi:hypothetical protein